MLKFQNVGYFSDYRKNHANPLNRDKEPISTLPVILELLLIFQNVGYFSIIRMIEVIRRIAIIDFSPHIDVALEKSVGVVAKTMGSQLIEKVISVCSV